MPVALSQFIVCFFAAAVGAKSVTDRSKLTAKTAKILADQTGFLIVKNAFCCIENWVKGDICITKWGFMLAQSTRLAIIYDLTEY